FTPLLRPPSSPLFPYTTLFRSRILWAAAQANPQALESYSEGADLPVSPALALRTAPLLVRLERALNRSSDGAVRADLAALPGHRSEEHTSELQSRSDLVCRLLL